MDNFEQHVAQAMLENPSWRYGQTLFNVLYSLFPNEANSIRESNIDPFYMHNNDARMAEFWEWYYATFY